ncbi:18638_t:CDS:2, partial [Gigaspora rosea]
MPNFITNHKDLFNCQFLFESTENWPWINESAVLGGAYSALGRQNKEYAIRAKKFARNQIKLAKKLQDPELECKCWIYYSEGLIQLEKFKKAKIIIDQQKSFVTNVLRGDPL